MVEDRNAKSAVKTKRAGRSFSGPECCIRGKDLQLEIKQQTKYESEKRQRLNEYEAENHGAAHASGCSWIAGNPFARCGRDTALSQTAAKSSDSDTETSRDHESRGINRRFSGRGTCLCKACRSKD